MSWPLSADIPGTPVAAATLDTTLVSAAHLHSVTRWVDPILALARIGSCLSPTTIGEAQSRRDWEFAGFRTLFHDALSSSAELCCGLLYANIVQLHSGFSSHDDVSPLHKYQQISQETRS